MYYLQVADVHVRGQSLHVAGRPFGPHGAPPGRVPHQTSRLQMGTYEGEPATEPPLAGSARW